MTDSFMTFFELLAYLLVFACLIFIAFVTTKFVGAKANKAMKGKHIEIIEAINLGLDKKIYLVKAGEQYVLLASSGKNLQFLTEVKLNSEDIVEDDKQEIGIFNFKSVFENYIKSAKKRKNEPERRVKNESDDISDDKADVKISYINKNIDRLRALNKKIESFGREDEGDKPE